MTASRSEGGPKARHRSCPFLAAFAFAVVLLTAGLTLSEAARAQNTGSTQGNAPLQLFPQSDDSGKDGASPQSGAAPAAPQAPSGTVVGGQAPGSTPAKEGIEILSLDAFDAGALGLLDAEASGLGATPWADTRRAAAVGLLQELPADVASPTLLSLGERLLLSNAAPPGGEDSATSRFMDLRLQRLFDWGRSHDVQKILARLPRSRQSEASGRLSVEALLAEAQDQAACELVRREIVAYHTQSFWAKALIYCQILAGEVEQAFLGLDLLREKGVEDDPLFTALAYRFAGADAKLAESSQASILNFAMLRHLDDPIPQGFAAQAPRALWPALAVSQRLDPLERASLSEAAFAGGLIAADVLAEAYRAVAFTPEELSGALSRGDAVEGVLGRALLYQAAEAQSLVVARVQMLRALLDLARSEERSATVLAVVAPMLHELRPRTDLAWFAETAAHSFYSLGELERARSWVRLIERDADTSAEAQAALLRLWPLARLNGHQGLLPDYDLAAWSAQLLGNEADDLENVAAKRRQVYLLLAAFQAMDLSDGTGVMSLPAWTEAEESLAVRYPLLLALQDAARDQRVGECLLLALSLEGARPWHQVAVVETAEILRMLRGLGFAPEVRQLAIEIALSNGL